MPRRWISGECLQPPSLQLTHPILLLMSNIIVPGSARVLTRHTSVPAEKDCIHETDEHMYMAWLLGGHILDRLMEKQARHTHHTSMKSGPTHHQ